MYKLTIIVAMAIGTISFVHAGTNQGKKGHSEKNDKISSPTYSKGAPDLKGTKSKESKISYSPISDQSKKGNKDGNGGSQKQGGSKDKVFQGGNDKGKQNKPIGMKPPKGNGKIGAKPHNSKQPDFGKQGKGHKGSGNHMDQKHVGGKHGKNDKLHFQKGHPNFGYMYVNTHGYYSHKNYGQWRSQQAKNKHKQYHPIYELQAIQGFNLIISRNNFLFTETNYKIGLFNTQLAKKRKANQITVVEYDAHVQRIAILQKRRASLQVNIEL